MNVPDNIVDSIEEKYRMLNESMRERYYNFLRVLIRSCREKNIEPSLMMEDLKKKPGVSKWVEDWSNDSAKYLPNTYTISLIADYLDIDMRDLLGLPPIDDNDSEKLVINLEMAK